MSADDRQLAVSPQVAASRDLMTMVDAGVLTQEQSRQVAQVLQAVPVLAQLPAALREAGALATPHHIGTGRMAVRFRTPQDQAVEVLARFQELWGPAQERMHRYRERYLQGRVALAKLNKAHKQLDVVNDPDDVEILEAEIALEEGRLAALQAELAAGQQELTGALAQITRCGEHYQRALTAAGRTELTAEDILQGQAEHLARDLWYRLAREHRTVHHPSADPREAGSHQLSVPERSALVCELLGISAAEIARHVGDIAGQYASWVRMNAGTNCSFAAHLEGWVVRTAAQYVGRIRGAIETDTGLLSRLRDLLPEAQETGTPRGQQMDRGAVTEL